MVQAETLTDTSVHGRVILPKGVIVHLDPATNQPDDGAVRWWVSHIDGEGIEHEQLQRLRDHIEGLGIGMGLGDCLIHRWELDPFTRAYIEAALWSSTDDDEEPIDAEYDIEDISNESIERIALDCARFQARYYHLWEGCETGRGEYDIDEASGHNFWLNRNGHGTGFWDSTEVYGHENAEQLDDASHSFGECSVFVSDDKSEVYFE